VAGVGLTGLDALHRFGEVFQTSGGNSSAVSAIRLHRHSRGAMKWRLRVGRRDASYPLGPEAPQRALDKWTQSKA